MHLAPLLRSQPLRIFVLLVALSLPAAADSTPTAPSRPNVLFILCDDIRWDAMSCAGHPDLHTPNIDRIANEGVRFLNSFCTTSLCSPSRASIMSGVYAHSHKVLNNFTEFPNDLHSFPRVLHDAGYATAYLGKWHMGEDNDQKRPGFDYWVSHKGQGKYVGTEFNLDDKERKVIPGYYTNIVTDLSLDWLKQRRAGQPWLLCLGHKAPHSFYYPEEKYAHVFDKVDVQYPASAFHLDDKPEWIRQRLYTWHGIYGPLFEWRKNFPDDRPEAVKDFAAMTHAYWGTILSVDDSVGRLLAYLEQSHQLDNTLIIFMGDNGLLNGEHGMVDKRTAHEPSLRVPILARYPGLTKTPKVIAQQVLTLDIAPSILELCGAPPLQNIQGKSWVKLVREGDPTWRTSWLYEYNYEIQFPYTPNVRAIRTEEWKYAHYPPGDGTPDKHLAELYNLKSDPDEDHNLILDPAYAGKVVELRAALEKLLKDTGVEHDTMPLDQGIKTTLPDQKIR
jgi:arylsulfatase A-like enzyme